MTSIHLTNAERELLTEAIECQPQHKQVAYVVMTAEDILTDHADRWEWNYGERVRRLESQLEATEAQLTAARSALAACREVRESRGAES